MQGHPNVNVGETVVGVIFLEYLGPLDNKNSSSIEFCLIFWGVLVVVVGPSRAGECEVPAVRYSRLNDSFGPCPRNWVPLGPLARAPNYWICMS